MTRPAGLRRPKMSGAPKTFPQWIRMDVQAGDRIWIDDQEVHVWTTHPQGRKILRTTFDTGEPRLDKE